MKGFTDAPIQEVEKDFFEIEKYVNGLVEYVKCCNTPMTIAIQGDWGSGKTSIMNLVKKGLPTEMKTIWFNTWQFSQFNMENQLSVSFLSCILEEVSRGNSESFQETKKGLNQLKQIARNLGKIGIYAMDFAGAQKLAEDIDGKLIESYNGQSSEEPLDVMEIVRNLKQNFQKAIHEIAKNDGERIVIFIDDLDRLQPARAVELLEILKIFLDCEKCVFVLAIDYEVVIHGIKQKYGDELYAKGRNFFDKIIQVPFKMPVAQYNIKKYVENSFKELGIEFIDVDSYVKLIKNSVGCNPRSMKRLFNTFFLLTKIPSKIDISDSKRKSILFAGLCLQNTFEETYNFLIDNGGDLTVQFFKEFKEKVEEGNDGFYLELKEIISHNDEYSFEDLEEFMQSFIEVFSTKKDELMEKDIKILLEILGLTSITSSGSRISNGINGKGVRYEKVLEKEAHDVSLANATKRIWNGCKIEGYCIGDKSFHESSNFTDFFVGAFTYAYNTNQKEFEALYHGNNTKISKSLKTCFAHEKSVQVLKGTDIKISSYSSSDLKVMLIKELFKELNLNLNDVMVRVRFAKKA